MSADRVLLVAGPATGGVAGHVAGLASGLAGLGWDVTVFTSPVTATRLPAAGTTLEVVPAWPTGRHNLKPALRTLRSLVKGASVVHAHGHQAGLLTVLAAATLRDGAPPVVVTWHNAVLGGGARRQAQALAELAQARRADLVTGASSDLVARARELGAKNPVLTIVSAEATVPPEPTDASTIELDALLEPRRGPLVLTVSRIAPQKRLDVLVDAAALVAAEVLGVRWVVAGDGDPELLEELERRRNRMNAPVTFLGRREDVPALLARADVFALSSDWEARPLAVQEAMAAGVPVVATGVGGVPDLLADAGELVEAGDAAALAAGVVRLLKDPARAADLVERARGRITSLPGEDEVTQGWSERYRRLISAP
ncbi:glycosyltransferase family 4 protein [Kineosporia succinea]|uniref:Glycosyltransferase involved in cell wall biosynthesis n=1 Tax=Kineosporia succinea TaxID=84632 RepID=A0ABT9P6N6_9ACTN|nr:glycosyltransferase family 4 protein [Kineosporia succinea]MDP9828358.1 glycosyltransferase involved in cell wall biosynthesis [Kineosporia succinea]